MKKYHLHDGQQQKGPFDLEELKQQQIQPSTHVWMEGLTEWVTANSIEELKPLFTGTPPPFTKAEPTPPKFEKAIPKLEQKIQPEAKSKSNLGKQILTIVGIIILVLIGISVYKNIDRQNQYESESNTKNTIKNNIATYVTASRSAFNYSDLGGISNLSITVSNNSEYMMDNVQVVVSYIKANGEIFKNETLDFAYLQPYKTMSIKAPDSNRGTSIQLAITKISSSALGL